MQNSGHRLVHEKFFDTIKISPSAQFPLEQIKAAAENEKVNLRYFNDGSVGITLDETVAERELNQLLKIFGCKKSIV